MFSTSAAPFLDVAAKARTAAYRVPAGLGVCFSRWPKGGAEDAGRRSWGETRSVFSQCRLHCISEKPDRDFPRLYAPGKRRMSLGSSEWGGPGVWRRARWRRLWGRARRRGCPLRSDVPGGGGATGWLLALPASSGCRVRRCWGDAAAARRWHCGARRCGSARSTAVAPRGPKAHPSRAMPRGAAPRAVLLAVLLAGLLGTTGRLLSGECARWGWGWFPGALGCGSHGTPAAADRLQGHGAFSLALRGEGGGMAPPAPPVDSAPPAPAASRGAIAERLSPASAGSLRVLDSSTSTPRPGLPDTGRRRLDGTVSKLLQETPLGPPPLSESQ